MGAYAEALSVFMAPCIFSWKVRGCEWWLSVGVTGSFAASLLVSSSSSSGMGLLRSTGRDSGDEAWLELISGESVGNSSTASCVGSLSETELKDGALDCGGIAAGG